MLLILHFEGHPEPVQTDIAGDKMIFRCRGDVRRFFARHGLAEGDSVVIERLSPYEYRLAPAPRIPAEVSSSHDMKTMLSGRSGRSLGDGLARAG
jgi:hypothetical protein